MANLKLPEKVWLCRCGCGEPAPPPPRPDRRPNGAYIQGHQHRIDPGRAEKKCSTCREVKPRDGFHKNRAMVDGLTNLCKVCNAASTKAWHDKHGRYSRYGFTPEDYREMWQRQEGLCALCETRPIAHIDHDHETGRIRGLLCRLCNHGLGKLGDTPESLERALAYVRGDL